MSMGIWKSPASPRSDTFTRDKETDKKIAELNKKVADLEKRGQDYVHSTERALGVLQNQIHRLEQAYSMSISVIHMEVVDTQHDVSTPLLVKADANEKKKNCEDLTRKKQILAVKIAATAVIVGSLTWLVFKNKK